MMIRKTIHSLLVLAMFAHLPLASGCSTLSVEVAVFDGPALSDIDSRTATAIGLSRNIAAFARELRAAATDANHRMNGRAAAHEVLLRDFNAAWDDFKIEDAICAFDRAQAAYATASSEYEAQYACNDGAVDDETCTTRESLLKARNDARRRVCERIDAYAHFTNQLVGRIGEFERIDRLSLLDPFLPSLPPTEYTDFLAALVASDETGRLACVMTTSVMKELRIQEELLNRLAERLELVWEAQSLDDLKEASGACKHDTELAKKYRSALAVYHEAKKREYEKYYARRDEAKFLARITGVMGSQSPGTLLTAQMNNPWWYGGFIRKHVLQIFDERFWKVINPLQVSGVGDVFVMLVKDDVGNWQLKSVKIDPSKVTEAATQATLKAISAAAKLSAPIP